ncbi:DUF4255 domain-containing protein [Paraburkholderia terrae]|uniref:DUF4255 domain-containing protein n=1 Tax=Paraburkholderia terrae TaxID=311230 RepID=UPI00296AA847|nr:DUF4255 domain-containing protein [Paraburkholderia terrae]MDW3660592.1 DUF4255 domain-containing protein [Paraburkholderia terrae]
MNADAILRVTDALKGRLDRALKLSKVPGNVFVGPLDDVGANDAVLILFLYRVVPNASLRNTERRVLSGDPLSPVLVYRNSLPFDLYFMVTVGSRPDPTHELLKALGFVIQGIQASPDLIGSEVDHDTVRVSLEPLTTEELSRIWALFPTANYRTSIAYLATPVWMDPSKLEREAKRVVEDSLRTGSEVAEGSAP